MTNERAIELLNRISDSQFDGIHGDERREALSMAVRALVEPNIGQKTIDCIIKRLNDEDRTMGDTISRQAAIDALTNLQGIIYASDGVRKGISLAWNEILKLPSAQPDVPEINVGDINKFIDSLEEIFADLRERNGDDLVCGLCEYDGAYIGQSGDWCNECPGFNRDDCFKLSDKCRKRWIDTITKALPSAQPQRKKGKWILVHEADENGNALYECSVRHKGETHVPTVDVSYCWNCGARMDGESE